MNNKYYISFSSVALLAALYWGFVEHARVSAFRHEVHQLSDRVDEIIKQRDRLSDELTASKKKLAFALSVTTQQSVPNAEDKSDGLIERVGQMKRALALNSGYSVPEFSFLSDEDWLQAARNMKKDTEIAVLQALGTLGQIAKQKFLPELRDAEKAYRSEYGEQSVIDPQLLKRYLANSAHTEILDRYEVWSGVFMEKSDWYLRERVSSGLWYNSIIYLSRDAVGITSEFGVGPALKHAEIQFKSEHGRNAETVAELTPYLEKLSTQRH